MTAGPRQWRVPVPGVAAARGYRRAWLGGDAVAGVTVAAYLVPQVMAYAGVAGVPAVAGLWAAVPPLALYALLGSSRVLSMGPESTTALMTATAVAPLAAGDPARYVVLAAGLALAVGVLALVAWLVRLGFVADLLSRPVLTGYLAGVAVLMIAGQLARLTRAAVTGQSVPSQVLSFARHLAGVQPATVVLAGLVLAFLFACGPGGRRCPARCWPWPSAMTC